MEFGNRAHFVAKRGDLADHIHAFFTAFRFRDFGQRLVRPHPHQTLGRHPQTAQGKCLQNFAHVADRSAFSLQLQLGGGEFIGNRGHGAAAGKAGAFPEAARAGAIQRHILIIRHDGARFHDFPGEQIAGAHQHAEVDAQSRQRLANRGRHRRRTGVMDATRENDGDLLALTRHHRMIAQRLDNRTPEHEAAQGPDMAATFAALDDETAHAFVKVMGQKAGGRGMGEGRDALRLEIQDLVDAAPGDDRVVGLHFVDGVDLRFQYPGVGKAQNPHAPGPVAQ